MKQNEDVCMYIEEFILVDIWIHCYTSWNLNCTVLYTELDDELNKHWKCCSLYTIATMEEKCENCS